MTFKKPLPALLAAALVLFQVPAVATAEQVNFNTTPASPFDPAQDAGTSSVADSGATLLLNGNAWKKITLPINVTAQTVMEFDFQGSPQGEIHAIGFDNDNVLSDNRMFQLWGTQTHGIQNYRTYTGSGWYHYTIPVGQHYTGLMNYLVFGNDHDVATPTAHGEFRNVQVYNRTTLIQEQFDSTGALHGKVPNITVGGAAWVAKSGTSVASGKLSLGGAQTDSLNLGANHYFGVHPGIYHLSVEVNLPAGSTNSNHYGVGFVVNPITTSHLLSSGSAAGLNPNGGTNGGTPWIGLRHDGMVFVQNAGTTIYASAVGAYTGTQTRTLKLALDTRNAQWRVDAFIDATQLDLNGGSAGMTYTFAANPIGNRFIAVSANNTAIATVDNLLLTRLTEPYVPVLQSDALVESIGVGVHTWSGRGKGNHVVIKDKLVGLGVRHVRDWLAIDQPAGTTGWQHLRDHGIRMGYSLTPNWGGLPAMKTYMISNGLVGSCDFIEGPNEPNNSGTWAPGTVTFCTELFNLFRGDSATAHLPIVAPALAINAVDMAPAHQALGNISSLVDYGNAHPYPGSAVPTRNLIPEQYLASINVGGKPLIATETGYHNYLATTSGHVPTSEAATALYTPRLFLEYLARGVVRTYYFDLLDNYTLAETQARGWADIETSFGLVRYDFTDKPAYNALKNLITLTNDPGAAFTPTRIAYNVTGSADVKSLLFQKRNGSYILAVWRDVSVWSNPNNLTPATANITVTFPNVRASAVVYYPTTSANAMNSYTNVSSVVLPLQGQVALVRF